MFSENSQMEEAGVSNQFSAVPKLDSESDGERNVRHLSERSMMRQRRVTQHSEDLLNPNVQTDTHTKSFCVKQLNHVGVDQVDLENFKNVGVPSK